MDGLYGSCRVFEALDDKLLFSVLSIDYRRSLCRMLGLVLYFLVRFVLPHYYGCSPY
jgi:hypothetical protein